MMQNTAIYAFKKLFYKFNCIWHTYMTLTNPIAHNALIFRKMFINIIVDVLQSSVEENTSSAVIMKFTTSFRILIESCTLQFAHTKQAKNAEISDIAIIASKVFHLNHERSLDSKFKSNFPCGVR
jgi:hypothetical protein